MLMIFMQIVKEQEAFGLLRRLPTMDAEPAAWHRERQCPSAFRLMF